MSRLFFNRLSNFSKWAFVSLFCMMIPNNLAAQTEPNQMYLKINFNQVTEEAVTDSLDILLTENLIIAYEKTFKLEHDSLRPFYTLEVIGPEYKLVLFSKANQCPWIEFVEEIPIYQHLLIPNDLNGRQWGLRKVNAEQAWDESVGDSLITIAIIDDGVLLDHEDLIGAIWKNPNEIPGNGIDDDMNGYIDDFNGFDVADNDPDVRPPPTFITNQYFSHGTHCAGIAGAQTNNAIGMASLGYNIRIIPVKAARSSSRVGLLTHLVQGIEYAVAAKANVINLSFGDVRQSSPMKQILLVANQQGIVCIAAAGNGGTDVPIYPANYPYVISVGATDSMDIKSIWSNFGGLTDVMAPGEVIWSAIATSNSAYAYMSGTSASSSLVSSLAALMLSKDPLMTPQMIEDCIKSTSVNIDALNPQFPGNLGAGRINAEAAMKCVKSVYALFDADMYHVCPGNQVQFTDNSLRQPNAWKWSFEGGVPATSSTQNPSVTYPNAGIYKVKLWVQNVKGADSLEKTAYITVALPTATLSGNYTIPTGYSAMLNINFTGTPPFRVKLKNGAFSYWIENIPTKQYSFPVTPQNTANYVIDSIFDVNCGGVPYGSAIVVVQSFSNGNCTNGTNTFQKHLKASGVEEMHNVIKCVDGGFMLIGTTTSLGAGGQDVFAIRTNDTGKVIWAQSMGSSGVEKGYSIKSTQTADSGFAITAVTTGFGAGGEDLYFLKLTKSGTIQIQTRFGGSGTDYGRAVAQLADGGYLIGGTSGSSPKSGAQDAYVIRTDSSGNVLWNKKFGFASTTTTHFISFEQLPSGNIWLIGHGDHFTSPYVSYLAKITTDGTILNEYRYSTSLFDAAIAATTLKDGKIAVASLSSSNSSVFNLQVFVIDTSGNVSWAKILSNNGNTRPTGVAATSDSGFVITGYTNGYGNGYEIFNVKFNKSGNVVWSRRYGSSSDEQQDSWSQCIVETSDGGLVFGFHTSGFGSSGKDLMLFKANECGFAGGCNETGVTFTINNLTLPRANVSAYTNDGVNANTVNTTVKNWNNIIDTVNVCVNQAPSVPGCKVTADFEVQTSCAGNASRFTNTSVDLSASTITYFKWQFTPNDVIEGIPSPQFVFPSKGVYDVTLIVGNNGNPACFDTLSRQIEIFENLNVEIAVEDTVCSLDSFSVGIGSLVCNLGKVSYNWTPYSVFNDSSLRSPTASLSSSSWIKVEIIDSLGNRARDSVFIFVNGTCCRSFAKFEIEPPVVCPGDSFAFINKSVAKPSAIFTWIFGSSASLTSYTGKFAPNVIYPNPGTYEVKLVVQDFCGTDTFELKAYVLKNPITLMGPDSVLCFADSIEVGETFLSSLAYTWHPGIDFSDSISAQPKVWVGENKKVYLDVYDFWTGCSNTDSLSLKIENLDTLKYRMDSVVCAPNGVLIDYLHAGVDVLWDDLDTSRLRNLTQSGTYRVEISRNYCSTLDTHVIQSVGPNVTMTGPDFLCKEDSGLYFINQFYSNIAWSNGASGDTFTYYNGEGVLAVLVSEGTCTYEDSILVERMNTPPDITGDDAFCEGDSLYLEFQNNGYTVNWNDGSSTNSIWAKSSGWYSVSIEKQNCILNDSIYITELYPPALNLGIDQSLCQGDTFTVNVIHQLGDSLYWGDGSGDSIKWIIDPGMYVLEVSNVCGTALDSIEVYFKDCSCVSYIPNVFTPNGDGKNDFFGPSYCEITNFKMIIFDRWGEILFETDDILNLWDGTYRGVPVPEGVFGYLIQYNSVTGRGVAAKGNVTVLYPD